MSTFAVKKLIYAIKNELNLSVLLSFVSGMINYILGAVLFIGNISMNSILLSFVCCMLICFAFIYRQKKSVFILCVCIIFPITLTSLPFIWKCCKNILMVSLLAAAAFSAVYLIAYLRLQNGKKNGKKNLQCVKGMCIIFTAVLFPLLSTVSFFTLSNLPVYSVSKQSVESAEIKITETEWEDLNSIERVELLSRIAANEAAELRIDNLPKIELCIIPGINGVYQDKSNVIKVDLIFLNGATAEKAVSLIAHELYHCYEFQLIGGNKVLSSVEAEKASVYKYEFDHYINGVTGDYDAYYNQVCEADSRAFGEAAVKKYFN